MTGGSIDIQFAVIVAIAAITLVLYLLVLLVGARLYARWVRARQRHQIDKWDAFLDSDMESFPASLELLGRKDTIFLMRQWLIAYQEEEARWSGNDRIDRLREIGRDVELDDVAGQLLSFARSRDEQLIAIQCLGATRRADAWPQLEALAAGDDPVIALAATEALVRIDADRGAVVLAAQLCQRPDWPEHVVGRLVRHLSQGGRQTLLAAVLQNGRSSCVSRLFRALEAIHHAGSSLLLEQQLESADHLDAIMQLLYASADENHIEELEAALNNARAGRFPDLAVPGWMHEAASKARPGWAGIPGDVA